MYFLSHKWAESAQAFSKYFSFRIRHRHPADQVRPFFSRLKLALKDRLSPPPFFLGGSKLDTKYTV